VPRANYKIIQFILQGLSDLISLSPPSKQTNPHTLLAQIGAGARSLAVAHSNRDLFVIPAAGKAAFARARTETTSAQNLIRKGPFE
jgi:hypothetical protein